MVEGVVSCYFLVSAAAEKWLHLIFIYGEHASRILILNIFYFTDFKYIPLFKVAQIYYKEPWCEGFIVFILFLFEAGSPVAQIGLGLAV